MRGFNRRWSQKEFENKVKEQGNGEYVVLSKYTTTNNKVELEHIECGYRWWTYPNNFLFNKGRCPNCVNVKSKGEEVVKDYLDKTNYTFYIEHTFDDLKNKNKLLCDFYLPELDLIIEFDGEQHYRPVDFFGGKEGYKKTIERDKIKNEYTKRNGINLLRIPYWDIDKVDFLIEEKILFIKESAEAS